MMTFASSQLRAHYQSSFRVQHPPVCNNNITIIMWEITVFFLLRILNAIDITYPEHIGSLSYIAPEVNDKINGTFQHKFYANDVKPGFNPYTGNKYSHWVIDRAAISFTDHCLRVSVASPNSIATLYYTNSIGNATIESISCSDTTTIDSNTDTTRFEADLVKCFVIINCCLH